ncbi:hypothetical protein CK203_072292 [Vitis vinifera]|uniref:Uncharacterized protein n=1 Tax=Vitis vinifera TaxID=29760 RepID=A0A438BV11_VITVI|nr:hypothetical protein CK203_072292 [Vitis vinifera]
MNGQTFGKIEAACIEVLNQCSIPKRRASTPSSTAPMLPRSMNQAASFLSLSCEIDLKGELKGKLPTILFDEELKARDSQFRRANMSFLRTAYTTGFVQTLLVPSVAALSFPIPKEAIQWPCSQQQEENIGVRLDISDSSSGQQMVPTDGSSSSSLREPGRSSELPTCMDSEMGYRDQESIVLHIETHSEI